MSRILGAVLAGGRSRRFGSDKAVARLQGRRLIDWVVGAIEPHVEAVVICGRSDGARRSLEDRPAGGAGPLAGLNAALHHGHAHGFDAVLAAACDMPLIPAGSIAKIVGRDGACFAAGTPVLGLWPCALAGRLDAWLAGDDRSVRGWAASVGALAVELDGPLPNVNTLADLDELSRQPASAAPP